MLRSSLLTVLLSCHGAMSADTCQEGSEECTDDSTSFIQSLKVATGRLAEDIFVPDHTTRHSWASEHKQFFLMQAEKDTGDKMINVLMNHSNDPDPLADMTMSAAKAPQITIQSLLTANTKACKTYPNLIRLGPAIVSGLIDRFNQLQLMGELAQSLCARIVPAPPCASLMSFLAGDNFSKATTWDHYVELSDTDGKSMFSAPDSKPEDRMTVTPAQTVALPPWGSSYTEVFDLQRSGVAFEWPTLFDYGTLPYITPMLRRRAVEAEDVQLKPSADVWLGVKNIYSKLKLQQDKYVTIHVRRKDAIRVCDTSPTKVISYASCSLDEMGWLNQTSEPLIVLTDEEDPKYIDDVVKGLKAKLKGRRVIYGDGEIRKAMPAHMQDDPFIFLVGLVIRWQARGEMFMDRTFCEKCAALRTQNKTFSQYALNLEATITMKAAIESSPSTKDSAKMLYNFHPSCVDEALKLTYDLGVKPLVHKLSPIEIVKLSNHITETIAPSFA